MPRCGIILGRVGRPVDDGDFLAWGVSRYVTQCNGPAPCGITRGRRRWRSVLQRLDHVGTGLAQRSIDRRFAITGAFARSLTIRRRSTLGRNPVSCALMSGLPCGACRWPSWVCASVSGTNLRGVLEAQLCVRYCLNCFDHSLSHTPFSTSCRISRACARRLPVASDCHATASAAAATRPFAW